LQPKRIKDKKIIGKVFISNLPLDRFKDGAQYEIDICIGIFNKKIRDFGGAVAEMFLKARRDFSSVPGRGKLSILR